MGAAPRIPHMPRPTGVLATVAGALAGVAMLAAGSGARVDGDEIQMPVRVLSVEGEWIDGTLRSADAGQWTIADAASGTERAIPCAGIAAFIVQRGAPGRAGDGDDATASNSAPLNLGMLETAAGQRLPGTFRATGTTNYWDHRWIGAIPITVDDIATMRLVGSRVPPRRADADTVLLLNGDTATGFVAALGLDVVLDPAAGSEGEAQRRISLDRIGAIALAESGATRAAGLRLWVADGSIVDGKDLRFDRAAGWGFQLLDPLLAGVRPARTDDNSAANPIAGLLGGAEVVPLGALPRPTLTVPDAHLHLGVEQAFSVRGTERALLGLARVELAGPVVARYGLPRPLPPSSGGSRADKLVFTTEIALAEPAPADVRVEVEVRLGGESSGRMLLDAANRRRSVRIAAPADAGELVVTVTDGGNGIAGDAIVLERACLVAPSDRR